VAGRAEARASRSLAWVGAVVGTAVASLVPLSFPLLDLTYSQPTDPPVILPVTVWPLAAVTYGVGLLFGPAAGLLTGAVSQILTLAQAGFDLTATWTWVLAGGLGGFLAGWLSRRLPIPLRSDGRGRYAGAAITGLLATTVGFVPIFLDPLIRADVTWPFVVGEYLTIVVPTAMVTALTLPLVLAVGLRLLPRVGIRPSEPVAPARPTWRPFALAYALGVLVVLAPLYLPSSVRVIGTASAAGAPAAAPGPAGSDAPDRSVTLSIGAPPAVDRSCLAEAGLHSPVVWAAVEVTIYNESGTAVGVSWLDYTGHRDVNQSIDAGDPVTGHWSANHPFVLTGADGGCLMIFKVLGTAPLTIHIRS
jgi:hypothetical protein